MTLREWINSQPENQVFNSICCNRTKEELLKALENSRFKERLDDEIIKWEDSKFYTGVKTGKPIDEVDSICLDPIGDDDSFNHLVIHKNLN